MDELISLDLLMRAKAEGLGELEHAHNLLLGLAKAASALAVIAGGAIAAFTNSAVNQFTQAGEAAFKMSEQMGISAHEASKWRESAKLFGVSGDEIGGAMNRISMRLGQMEIAFKATGKLPKQLAGTFHELGIKLQDGHGHFRSMNDIMYDSMDAMGKMTDVQERARIGMQLFGRGASKDLIEMMKAGKIGIQEAMAQTDKWGASLTDKGVADAMAYVKVQRMIGVEFDGIKNKVAQAALPYFKMFADWMAGDGVNIITRFVTVGLGAFGNFINFVRANWPIVKHVVSEVLLALQPYIALEMQWLQFLAGVVKNVVLPAIEYLAHYIKNEIIPKLAEFGGTLRDILIPVIQDWYTQLQPIIRDAIPFLKDLLRDLGSLIGTVTGFVREHKDGFIILGQILGMIVIPLIARFLDGLKGGLWILEKVAFILSQIGGALKSIGEANPGGGMASFLSGLGKLGGFIHGGGYQGDRGAQGGGWNPGSQQRSDVNPSSSFSGDGNAIQQAQLDELKKLNEKPVPVPPGQPQWI